MSNVVLDSCFVIIKPDAIEKGLTDSIFIEIDKVGLNVLVKNEVQLTRKHIFDIWPDIYGCSWIDRTVKYLTSGPVIACVVVGQDATQKMRKLKVQLRKSYPADDKVISVIHTSDSVEEFSRGCKSVLDQLNVT